MRSLMRKIKAEEVQQLHHLICFSSAVGRAQNVCPLDNEQPVIKANIIKALVGSTNMP